jgi:FemAB family
MTPKLQSHFTHNIQWANLWLQSKSSAHSFFCHSVDNLNLIVYEYPFLGGQVFWLITSFGQLQSESNIDKPTQFIQSLVQKAKNQGNVVMIKTNWNPDYVEQVFGVTELQEDSVVVDFLGQSSGHKVVKPKKNLQNNSTILLDLSISNPVKPEKPTKIITSDTLKLFLEESKDFWATTSSNIRRYTKKSLTQDWIVDSDKNNFQEAYQLLQQKSQELQFYLHPKEFVGNVVNSECGHLVCIKNQKNEICGCWIGINIDGTILYWYGANNQESFDHYGQYLMHLVAIYIAYQNNCKIYDLGGYSPTLGFGKFKELYRGRIFHSFGDYDIILKPLYYQADQLLVKLKNLKK